MGQRFAVEMALAKPEAALQHIPFEVAAGVNGRAEGNPVLADAGVRKPPVVEGLVVQAHPVLAAVKTGDFHGGPVDLRDHLRGAGELQQLPGPLLVGQVMAGTERGAAKDEGLVEKRQHDPAHGVGVPEIEHCAAFDPFQEKLEPETAGARRVVKHQGVAQPLGLVETQHAKHAEAEHQSRQLGAAESGAGIEAQSRTEGLLQFPLPTKRVKVAFDGRDSALAAIDLDRLPHAAALAVRRTGAVHFEADQSRQQRQKAFVAMIDVEDGREVVDGLLELVERSGGKAQKGAQVTGLVVVLVKRRQQAEQIVLEPIRHQPALRRSRLTLPRTGISPWRSSMSCWGA